MPLVARQDVSTGITAPGVRQSVFLGFVWAGVAVSCVLLAVRLYSRFRGPGRLFLDDAFAMFAFTLITITGALWQWTSPDMYSTLDVGYDIEPLDTDTSDRLHRWLMVSMIVGLFFYTSLASIKLSFLLFFRRIGTDIKHFRWLWWTALVFTLAGYFVMVGTEQYHCLLGSTEEIVLNCSIPSTLRFADTKLKVDCALDVVSDCIIMLLPVILLWHVHLRCWKKFAFIGLFLLCLITMAVAIAYAADVDVTRRPNGRVDNTFIWLWRAIEAPLAFAISCLSACSKLYQSPASPTREEAAFSPSESYQRLMSQMRSVRNDGIPGRSKTNPLTLADLSMVSTADDFDYVRAADGTSDSKSSKNSRSSVALQQHEQQHPVLVPHGAYFQKPVVQCYRGDDGEQLVMAQQKGGRGKTRGGQIIQSFEYRVTRGDQEDEVVSTTGRT